MLASYLIGVGALVVLVLGWAGVQAAWRRIFSVPAGADALAGKIGCFGCGCDGPCERELRTAAQRVKETS